MTIYDLNYYNETILQENTYCLPELVLQTIAKLTSELGVSTVATTVVSNNRPTNKRVRNRTDWKRTEPFKTTTLIQYEGLDKKISEIRTYLNKLSAKNYDTMRDSIFEQIDEICQNECDAQATDEQNERITSCILDVAKNNAFYAELYARIYNELITTYTFLEISDEMIIDSYLDSVDAIRYVDADEDYDMFCKVNKENDHRRAFIAFITHLVLNGTVHITKLYTILQAVLNKIKVGRSEKGQVNINNELIENLSVIITAAIKTLVKTDEWSSVYEEIAFYTTCKVSENPGLTSRAKFKFMVLCDTITKNT